MGKAMQGSSDGKNDKMINYLRNSVFIINALFTVIAACVFIIGTNISSKYGKYDAFLNSYHVRTIQMLTVSGIISTFLALLGMLGAAKYNSRCLNVQNIFLFALLLMELAVIITGVYILVDVKEPIRTKMLQSIPKAETNQKVRNSWNYVQEDSHCCGVNSPDDWHGVIPNGANNGSVLNHNGVYRTFPLSCCNSYNCSSGNLFENGCLEFVVEYISKTIRIVTFLPVAVMLLQVILIVLSCFLLKYIRQSKLYQGGEEHGINRPQNVSFFISSTSLLDKSRM